MYDNEYFVVDMVSCSSTGEIVNSLSLALETLNNSGKKIVLKLSNNYLNQSQLLSIQSLVTSYGCILDTIETVNPETAAVAENMNIFVQKPIEKRIEEKYDSKPTTSNFEPFSLDINAPRPIENPIADNEIALKEVNGLHFEADLDAIQKQQDNIDIKSDLKEVGINPKDDIKEIEKQIASKYPSAQDVYNSVDNYSKIVNPVVDNYEQNKLSIEIPDLEKKSIGVYKKAYNESVDENDWEEVDFYETPTTDPIVSDSKVTTYINQTLRSGQILESEGNVVIIGDCHPGSEIRAVGDITVWGVLSGIAHAGCKGNVNAKVRALKLNAVQLRIGNCYSRRPDGTNIPYILKTSVFTPEEARVVDDEIVLYKINQN